MPAGRGGEPWNAAGLNIRPMLPVHVKSGFQTGTVWLKCDIAHGTCLQHACVDIAAQSTIEATVYSDVHVLPDFLSSVRINVYAHRHLGEEVHERNMQLLELHQMSSYPIMFVVKICDVKEELCV